MDDDLQRRIADDLWKSGFGSELKAVKAFEEREGWAIITGSAFFDSLLNKSRELDFTAHKHRFRQDDKGDFLFNVTVSLIAEVKKSEKPWAVFRSSKWATPELLFSMNAVMRFSADPPQSDVRLAFTRNCVIASNKWFGHGVHEVFKKPNDYGRWFSAAAKTCRASVAVSESPLLKFQEDTWVVEYIQPLVILDGTLFAVALGETGELIVESIPFATVQFEEHDRDRRGAFVVDLVTLESFPRYLDHIERGFDDCFNRLGEYRPGVRL